MNIGKTVTRKLVNLYMMILWVSFFRIFQFELIGLLVENLHINLACPCGLLIVTHKVIALHVVCLNIAKNTVA